VRAASAWAQRFATVRCASPHCPPRTRVGTGVVAVPSPGGVGEDQRARRSVACSRLTWCAAAPWDRRRTWEPRQTRGERLHQTFHPQVSGLSPAPAGDGKEGTQRRARHPCPTRGNTHYGAFNRSELYPFPLRRINAYLVRWLRKKYRRLRGFKTAHAAWARLTTRCPRLFAHWQWVHEERVHSRQALDPDRSRLGNPLRDGTANFRQANLAEVGLTADRPVRPVRKDSR